MGTGGMTIDPRLEAISRAPARAVRPDPETRLLRGRGRVLRGPGRGQQPRGLPGEILWAGKMINKSEKWEAL